MTGPSLGMKINILTELIELDASLDGQEDITNEGGPNDAMRIRYLLAMAIPRLTALVDAADELAASVEFKINDSRCYKLDDLRSALRNVRAGGEI